MRRTLVGLSCAAPVLLLGLALAAGPATDGGAAAGRMLAIAVTTAERQDLMAAVRTARQAGSGVMTLSLPWDEVETSPGQYGARQPWLPQINQYFPSISLPVALSITPIDVNNDHRPADLRGKPWDDPAAIARFNGMLDWVLGQVPDLSIVCVSLGNEVESVLKSDAAQWGQYERFFAATAAHARKLRPGLVVGCKLGSKVLLPGGEKAVLGYARALNSHADAVLVTYYPIQNDFTVKDPAVVHADMRALCTAYEGRPIYMLEAGYPSSAVCGGSEERQAEFVRQLFSAWDEHAAQVRLVCYFCLTELGPADLAKYQAYFGGHTAKFAGFLGTLGLRTWPGEGQDKPACAAFRAEAAKRGFGVGE
jgi:hypothetical protein